METEPIEDENEILTHRNLAYKEIYLKDRNKYPLPFYDYYVHHKDRNRKNNNLANIELLTWEEERNLEKKSEFPIKYVIAGLSIVALLVGFTLYDLNAAQTTHIPFYVILLFISVFVTGVFLVRSAFLEVGIFFLIFAGFILYSCFYTITIYSIIFFVCVSAVSVEYFKGR